VISLGHFCSTALELQRYGLRDGSYPLDWNISHIEPTMALVESGFQGFLQLELLERDPERSDVVNDKGSGIAVYNSFSGELPIAAQYETVRARYARRIKRYRRAVAQPTLFVRYMVDGEEFSYLDEHMPAVLAALRKTNPGNDLLLIGNADLPATCGGLPVYTVEVDDGDVVARRFAGKNRELNRKLLGLNYLLWLRVTNLLRFWRPLQRLRRRLRLGTRLRAAAKLG
jgi:hypothetical protein